MAYKIYGENDIFSTTNGGGQWLVDNLAAVAGRPNQQDLSSIASLLRCDNGTPAFVRLHPVTPLALGSAERLRGFATLVARLAGELAREQPDLPNFGFDRELRLHWIAQLLHLHSMLRGAIRPRSAAPRSLRVLLSTEDSLAVELERLQLRRPYLASRPLNEAIALEDVIVTLLLRQAPSRRRDQHLAQSYHERLALYRKRGMDGTVAYRESLRLALYYESDETMTEALKEVLAGDWR